MESYSLGMSYKLRVSKSITFGDQGTTDISARMFSQTGGVIKHNAEFWRVNYMWERKTVKKKKLFSTYICVCVCVCVC